MRGRIMMWVAFAAVHVIVGWLGWVLPNQPMGDVYLVYEPWSTAALGGTEIVGITEPWVYPHLALAPMMLTHALAWLGGYTQAWAVLVTLCDAAAFRLLLGDGRSRGRRAAARFWLAFVLLLGPVGMYRIDAVTVPLAIAGLLWLARRPMAASALLASGAWIKVWPAALLAAAFVAVRRRLDIVAGALVTSAVVAGAVVLAGGAAHLLGFVTAQTDRGLQLEAPVSSVYLWGAVLDVDGWWLFYDDDILTFQVTGPHVDIVIAAMTPALALAAGAILLLGAVKARRGAPVVRLLPPLALALVVALIALNKVGSPQFHDWLIAPLVLWIVLDRRRARPLAALALLSAALTQVVYPLLYGELLAAQPVAAAALTARNLVLVVLLVWAVVRVARVPVRLRRDAPVVSVP
ncbi:glycosyltransferase 87 family protein [Microbacterium sp. Root53]|uniref:glycosyltransferase 87 family protein n=1 Tax=Microbacterium sp. Root53 TaxID=1736553 RepID=UPI000ADD9DEA|nr:glycosyltransferase 87 family protein [Microbacterium sp. Root53]